MTSQQIFFVIQQKHHTIQLFYLSNSHLALPITWQSIATSHVFIMQKGCVLCTTDNNQTLSRYQPCIYALHIMANAPGTDSRLLLYHTKIGCAILIAIPTVQQAFAFVQPSSCMTRHNMLITLRNISYNENWKLLQCLVDIVWKQLTKQNYKRFNI